MMKEQDSHKNIFRFEEPKNTACFVCDHVMSRERDILFVCHDVDDNNWQFLCGQNDHTDDNIRIKSLEQVINLDNSVNDLHAMPKGVAAEREKVGSKWNPFKMKNLLALLFAIPTVLFAQQDSMFYDTGELMNISFYYESGLKKSRTYFYKTGEFKGESFYDLRGVLNDGYTLDVKGDTIGKSHVPLFNAQPKKDLSPIDWEMQESGISVYIEVEGNGKDLMVGDEVEVWYIGYFEDGTQFDNSDITLNSLKFTIGKGMMLKSFEEGLLKFRSGSSGYIKIPYHLAYGDQVMGNLPAKSNLIYYIKPTSK